MEGRDGMNAQQNTEFSLVEKAERVEPVLVVAPVRCDEGKRLIHQWAQAVKNEQDRDKCLQLFFDRREYDEHRKGCVACTEYDWARVARYK